MVGAVSTQLLRLETETHGRYAQFPWLGRFGKSLGQSGILGEPLEWQPYCLELTKSQYGLGYDSNAIEDADFGITPLLVSMLICHATAMLVAVAWWSWTSHSRFDDGLGSVLPVRTRLRLSLPSPTSMVLAGLLWPTAPYFLWIAWEAIYFRSMVGDPTQPRVPPVMLLGPMHKVWIGFPTIGLIFAAWLLTTIWFHISRVRRSLDAALDAKFVQLGRCPRCGYLGAGSGVGPTSVCVECGDLTSQDALPGRAFAVPLVSWLIRHPRRVMALVLLLIASLSPSWGGVALYEWMTHHGGSRPLGLDPYVRFLLTWAADWSGAQGPFWR